MRHRKLAVGAIGVSVSAVAAIGAARRGGRQRGRGAAPSKVVVKQKFSVKMVPNRYIQDPLRW